jgi:hypothetical protein
MTYGGIDLTGPSWGLDSAVAGVLTDEQLLAMYQTPLPNGMTPKFIWGYCPLPGNSSKWDWTGPRMRAACDIGWVVFMVQHCRAGAWTASEAQGKADGQHAAEYGAAHGYPDDCHLAADDESVRNPGPDAIAHFNAWTEQPKTPCLYEGFAPGMTPNQLYSLPSVSAYWGAYGPWNVSVRGVRCRQGRQIVHCGVGVDPDYAAPDNLGGVLRGMAKID